MPDDFPGRDETVRAFVDSLFSEGTPRVERYPDIASVMNDVRELHALSALDMSRESVVADFEASAEGFDFMDMEPSAAFKRIDVRLGQYFLEKARAAVGPSSGISQCLEEVFKNREWRAIPDNSALQGVLLGLYARMTYVRGILIRKYVDEGPRIAEHMSPVAQIEMRHLGNVSDAINAFFLKWERQGGRVLSTEEREARDFKNPCAVISLDADDEPVEVPWHEAFPGDCCCTRIFTAGLGSRVHAPFLFSGGNWAE